MKRELARVAHARRSGRQAGGAASASSTTLRGDHHAGPVVTAPTLVLIDRSAQADHARPASLDQLEIDQRVADASAAK